MAKISRKLKAIAKKVLSRTSEAHSVPRTPSTHSMLRTPSDISGKEKDAIKHKVQLLGPWFHNMNLAEGVWTNPIHAPGPDYPAWRWDVVEPLLGPVAGKSCLDIGCSSGFFSLKLRQIGAARVLGIDRGEQTRAIEQARFAAECLRVEVEFRNATVEDIALTSERFDLVVFCGVFYHLRHPLQALESVRKVCSQKLIMQSITTKHPISTYEPCRPPSWVDSRLRADDLSGAEFPSLRFIEGKLDGDGSCWFVPSPEAVLAMLRTSGFQPETMIFPSEYEMIVSAAPI